MKIKFLENKKNLINIFLLSLIGFFVLSWWVLFRDERALEGFEAVYPFFNGQLFFIRAVLLRFSLNFIPTVIFAFLGLISFGVYYLLLKQNHTVNNVVKFAVIFQVIVFFSYPVLSTDIFSYVFSNRVETEYNQNKWKVPPSNFSDDVFEQFADWKEKTNVYGYVNHLLYVPANYLGNDDVFTTILLYKITTFIFALAIIFIYKKLLEKKSEKEQSYYLKLVLWNPLFLLELVGNGHNDIFLIFFILASILAWKNKKYLLSGILIALSVQIKLISIVFFGYFALNLFQNKKFKEMFNYSLAFILINIISFILMDVSPIAFINRVFYNAGSYWQALPGLAARFLPELSIPFTLLFALTGIFLVAIQLKKKLDPILVSVLAIFLYLVFFAGAYWNWYVLWVFMFTPFIKNNLFRNTLLVFTFTSLMAYPLLWLSHRFGFGNSLWDIVQYTWLFVTPLLYFILNLAKERKS